MESLNQLAPWFFALDHTNYSRWLPVHVRDMTGLGKSHPTVQSVFQRGLFVMHKTQRPFPTIAIDHAHEQNNKCVKGNVDAVGLTENTSQLLHWNGGRGSGQCCSRISVKPSGLR